MPLRIFIRLSCTPMHFFGGGPPLGRPALMSNLLLPQWCDMGIVQSNLVQHWEELSMTIRLVSFLTCVEVGSQDRHTFESIPLFLQRLRDISYNRSTSGSGLAPASACSFQVLSDADIPSYHHVNTPNLSGLKTPDFNCLHILLPGYPWCVFDCIRMRLLISSSWHHLFMRKLWLLVVYIRFWSPPKAATNSVLYISFFPTRQMSHDSHAHLPHRLPSNTS